MKCPRCSLFNLAHQYIQPECFLMNYARWPLGPRSRSGVIFPDVSFQDLDIISGSCTSILGRITALTDQLPCKFSSNSPYRIAIKLYNPTGCCQPRPGIKRRPNGKRLHQLCSINTPLRPCLQSWLSLPPLPIHATSAVNPLPFGALDVILLGIVAPSICQG